MSSVMEGGCLVASSLEWSSVTRCLDRSSWHGTQVRSRLVPSMHRARKHRTWYNGMSYFGRDCLPAALFCTSTNLHGSFLYVPGEQTEVVASVAPRRKFLSQQRQQRSISASLGQATEAWMEEYMKDESDSESEMASPSGRQQQDVDETAKDSREGHFARAVVVAEGLAVTAAGVVFAGQALGLIQSPSQKQQKLAMVSSGKALPPPPPSSPIMPWWQLFPIWVALAINFLSRALHLFLSRPRGGRAEAAAAALGWPPPSERAEAARLMEERLGRIEEDVGTTIKMVRKLSRQMEKLGIRFRVTRRTLKAPIEETAELAKKTSLATEDLAARALRLERELQELQQLLLAMQTQSGRQLELVATLTQAVKTNRHGPVLKLPHHRHRTSKADARHAHRKDETAQQSSRDPSSGEEKGVLQKLGDFGRGVFGLSDDEGGGPKAEGRPPSSRGRRSEDRETGETWAGLARKGASARNSNGKLGGLSDDSRPSGSEAAAKDRDMNGMGGVQSFRAAGGSEQSHSLRPKGNGHQEQQRRQPPTNGTAKRPPATAGANGSSSSSAVSDLRPADGVQGPPPVGPELRARVAIPGPRKSVDFWKDPQEGEAAPVRREGLQEGARSPEPQALDSAGKGREGEPRKGEESSAQRGGEGSGEGADQATGAGAVGGDLPVPDAGGEAGGKPGEGTGDNSQRQVVKEIGGERELPERIVDGADVTWGSAPIEGDWNAKPARQNGNTPK